TPLSAEDVEYTLIVPTYPKGLPNGYAYVFQYSKQCLYKNRKTVSLFLGGTVVRSKYSCTGVSHCEYLQNELETCSHSEVNDALYDKLRQLRETEQIYHSVGEKEAIR
ncbi:hypothetical protein K505DRAFT_261885, partial [Melanomma pulvis-pyrius CBS 109.77]